MSLRRKLRATNRLQGRDISEVRSNSCSAKAIVGLGNPGAAYRNNRHNLGFMVIDLLAEDNEASLRRGCRSHLGSCTIQRTKVYLAKPRTYMNNSGRAVLSMMTRYALALEDIIIVADDINLPVGTLRIRRKGSCGGHRGLDSIAQHIGSKDFARLRVGVGSPEGVPAEDYVLEDFREEDIAPISEAKTEAAKAVSFWVAEGIDATMNRFN